MGQGDDPEEGLLADERLTWYLWTPESSIGLGSGALLSVGQLAAGAHTIVLNAADADGNVGVAFRTIYVGERAANAVSLPLISAQISVAPVHGKCRACAFSVDCFF